jgi:multidrug resistance efflux pump
VELARARRDIKAAELRAAEAHVEAAKTDQARIQALFEQNSISKRELDEVNAKLRDREAERDIEDAELREAEVQLKQAERRRNQPEPHAARPGSGETNEVKLAKIRRNIKEAAVRAATARLDAALANLKQVETLNKGGAGFVSPSEIDKAQAEVNDREAQRDAAQAELQEAELFVADAERLAAHPESQTLNSLRLKAIDTDALDRRLKAIELKLDQILKALDSDDQAH